MRHTGWLIAIVLVAGLFWLFPVFHIVPLERATKERMAATFDPKEFTLRFWNDQLLKSLDKAVKAEVLLPAIQADAAAAKKKFSRSVGIGESYTYFVSGKGRVVAVSDDAISLGVSEPAKKAEVSLQVGLLFGNAVRDGTGLLDVNDYPNSQDFNGISEALNRIIEERVQPKLREQAKVGVTVRFVGCAEVNEASDLKPLKVVPIQAVVE
jgi:predicted lipoprotein